MRDHLVHAAAGLVLGAVLTLCGFTDFGEMRAMLTLADLRLVAVFAGALGVAALGFRALSLHRLREAPVHRGSVPGAELFGLGWGLVGCCPAVPLVQLGTGDLTAAWALGGLAFGVWAGGPLTRALGWEVRSCSGESLRRAA